MFKGQSKIEDSGNADVMRNSKVVDVEMPMMSAGPSMASHIQSGCYSGWRSRNVMPASRVCKPQLRLVMGFLSSLFHEDEEGNMWSW